MNLFERVALEAIDFQKDDFGEKLVAKVKEIYQLIDSGQYSESKKCKEVDDLVVIIKNRLGMTVKFVRDTEYGPAIVPFHNSETNIMVKDMWRDSDEIVGEENRKLIEKFKTGTVDTKKAKLGGVFSEYVNLIWFNFKDLYKVGKLTPRETVAVLLHELGHGFYICEYSKRLERTNQVMSEIAERLKGKDKQEEKEYILTELRKINKDLTEKEVEDLLNDSKLVSTTALLNVIYGTGSIVNLSQLTNPKYNEISFEALADNFSTKFGFGKDCVSALSKLTETARNFKSCFYILNAFGIYIKIFLLIIFIGAALKLSVLGIFASIFLVVHIIFSCEDKRDYTHNDLVVRYTRIRSTIINALKSDDLSRNEIQVMLENIKQIDEIVKKTKVFIDIYRVVMNIVVPSNRRTRSDIERQKLNELLASNDLFVRSKEFELLK